MNRRWRARTKFFLVLTFFATLSGVMLGGLSYRLSPVFLFVTGAFLCMVALTIGKLATPRYIAVVDATKKENDPEDDALEIDDPADE